MISKNEEAELPYPLGAHPTTVPFCELRGYEPCIFCKDQPGLIMPYIDFKPCDNPKLLACFFFQPPTSYIAKKSQILGNFQYTKTIPMGKFVITKSSNGEFRFKLKAGNGEVILVSEGYASKSGCDNGIESVRTNSQHDERYEKKTSTNGKHYFNLKATNGQIVGTSEMYESASGRDNGITSVKTNAPTATVEG